MGCFLFCTFSKASRPGRSPPLGQTPRGARYPAACESERSVFQQVAQSALCTVTSAITHFLGGCSRIEDISTWPV